MFSSLLLPGYSPIPQAYECAFSSRKHNNIHSIREYIQIGKLVVSMAAQFQIVETLVDKSAQIILSSPGIVVTVS